MGPSPSSDESRNGVEQMFDVGAAAARLSVKRSTVRTWIATGRLAAVKIGAVTRVPASALAALIVPRPVGAGRRVPPRKAETVSRRRRRRRPPRGTRGSRRPGPKAA